MPSQKPRVALTMPPELDVILDRLSELKGVPKTRLIIEILENFQPILIQMIPILEKINSDQENARQALKSFGLNLVNEASSQLGDIAKEVKKL